MSWPQFHRPRPMTMLRLALSLSAILLGLALVQFRAQIIAEELYFTSANFRSALFAGYGLLGVLLALSVWAWIAGGTSLLARFESLGAKLRRLGLGAGLLLPLAVAGYLWLLQGFYGRFLTDAFPRLLLFWLAAVIVAALLAAWRAGSWLGWLPLAVAGLALVHNAAGFFQLVTSYPLSIDWSEISRYYQASFYVSERVYGEQLPLPVTHPSRYLLQAVPFLLGQLPLWAHRLWQAVLWVGMALVTAVVLRRRLDVKPGRLALLFVAWVYLYLMQGAVFYHLLPCVFIVLWGFDRQRLGRSLVIVLIASVWAGISRINWAPMPGALAALLYILETPMPAGKRQLNLRYWRDPAIYFLGGSLAALGAYWLYIQNSGVEDISQFGSSFTSALLWERLWPNAFFLTGILPGAVLISLPLWLVIAARLRNAKLHPLRLAAMGLILFVFFVGGLVVSVKIGGGTNLHNMDAYMVLLLVAAAQMAVGRLAEDGGQASGVLKLSPGLAAFLLMVPVLFAVLSGGPLNLPSNEDAEAAIALIQEEVDWALEQNMDVLFISQRHLITFQMVDAPLVHEYEKLFLMEMAISHNDPYLVDFEEDIDDWRFGVIISDPLYSNLKDVSEDPLAAENNAWVRSVARPILCAYRVAETYNALGLEILKPRFGAGKCNQ